MKLLLILGILSSFIFADSIEYKASEKPCSESLNSYVGKYKQKHNTASAVALVDVMRLDEYQNRLVFIKDGRREYESLRYFDQRYKMKFEKYGYEHPTHAILKHAFFDGGYAAYYENECKAFLVPRGVDIVCYSEKKGFGKVFNFSQGEADLYW